MFVKGVFVWWISCLFLVVFFLFIDFCGCLFFFHGLVIVGVVIVWVVVCFWSCLSCSV